MSKSKTTTDHEVIRQWAEKRKGTPATVAETADDDGAGILRIDFPGYAGEQTLEPISWDEFFDKFDESELAFVYQEEIGDGDPSRFCKFVARRAK
jgi:hypothetical protein